MYRPVSPARVLSHRYGQYIATKADAHPGKGSSCDSRVVLGMLS